MILKLHGASAVLIKNIFEPVLVHYFILSMPKLEHPEIICILLYYRGFICDIDIDCSLHIMAFSKDKIP